MQLGTDSPNTPWGSYQPFPLPAYSILLQVGPGSAGSPPAAHPMPPPCLFPLQRLFSTFIQLLCSHIQERHIFLQVLLTLSPMQRLSCGSSLARQEKPPL